MGRTLNKVTTAALLAAILLSRCNRDDQNEYKDNSPTSGRLKIYFDESLRLHAVNQAYTFESQYERVKIELRATTEDEAVKALFSDSCEAILISRLLNEKEKALFATRQFYPKYSAVAKSGLALIANASLPLTHVSRDDIKELLSGNGMITDSTGRPLKLRALVDRSNSSVAHYLADSVLKGGRLSDNCSAAEGTEACISYLAENPNAIGFIDFAWLSDRDDPLYARYAGKIRFIGVKTGTGIVFPSQSSFKTGDWPYTRTVYVMRKTGEFTLAKGFESFVAGPKGQLTFLKQGLLPTRQAERSVQIRVEEPSQRE
jgi:phosphate transport system substrate-binding protein